MKFDEFMGRILNAYTILYMFSGQFFAFFSKITLLFDENCTFTKFYRLFFKLFFKKSSSIFKKNSWTFELEGPEIFQY